MRSLAGKVALITGASRGLGRAIALAYAAEGASLGVCARGSEALEAVAAEARALGSSVVTVAGDLRSARDIERLFSLTLDSHGRIDILVNNASELGPTPLQNLSDLRPDALSDLLEVNLLAPLRLTQAALGDMVLRGSGLVINVSSDAAVNAYPGWGGYGVSKAALDALTRIWRAELEGTGVRIVAVDPGDMDTEMHRAALPDEDTAGLARPEDVARAFVRLAVGEFPEQPRLEAASLS